MGDSFARVIPASRDADFIPEARAACFKAALDPRVTVTHWVLTLEELEVREDDSLVRVRVSPILESMGLGKVGVLSLYRELYRLVDGRLEYAGGDPPTSQPLMMGGSG